MKSTKKAAMRQEGGALGWGVPELEQEVVAAKAELDTAKAELVALNVEVDAERNERLEKQKNFEDANTLVNDFTFPHLKAPTGDLKNYHDIAKIGCAYRNCLSSIMQNTEISAIKKKKLITSNDCVSKSIDQDL